MELTEMIRLGVNIDHIATIRQARRGTEPDPVYAASIAELSGADGITIHLREDLRHIQERDALILRKTIQTRLNLEMAASEKIVRFAEELLPNMATLVPEKREEVTTEGGLDVLENLSQIKETVSRLHKKRILVSLFIDPEEKQIAASKSSGANFVEFHTGKFATSKNEAEAERECQKLHEAAELAASKGLRINAGHGLNYWNVSNIVTLRNLEELNIGHSIISRSVFVGLAKAVSDMKKVIFEAEMRRKP